MRRNASSLGELWGSGMLDPKRWCKLDRYWRMSNLQSYGQKAGMRVHPELLFHRGTTGRNGRICAKVPCTAKFDEELREDTIVVIKGNLTADPLRFEVNFQRGDHPNADILFHFNPRFKEDFEKVVFNSRRPSGWGFQGEEHGKIASGDSPFKLVFMLWNNSFQVSVNGRHILDYPHRFEDWKPDTIIVVGDIQVESIDVLKL